MSTAYPLASRIVWSSWGGGAIVEVDRLTAGLGLSAAVEPARAPVQVYDGAGDLHLIYGPGADRVRITVQGSGRQVPSLVGLTLGALIITIYWPDLKTTAATVTSPGIVSRTTDLPDHITGWRWEGVGVVQSGTDPLGR